MVKLLLLRRRRRHHLRVSDNLWCRGNPWRKLLKQLPIKLEGLILVSQALR
jgi:hypothetical protein